MGVVAGVERGTARQTGCVLVGLAGIAGAVLPSSAVAQSASDILPPTREEVTREQQTQAQIRAPRLEVEGGIERAPCALDSPEFQAIRLNVRRIEFDGLKGMTAQEIAPAYQWFIGRDQPVSVVCDIRDRVGTMLRDAGYVAAVQVPEQSIENGVIRLRVLMAHLAAVRVRGDAGGAERTIAGYLGRLTDQPVFNKFQAERYLLLASDIPGYTVRLTLRPAGGAPGEVVGDVTVQHLPAYVDSNIQNFGSKALGPWGGLARAQLYGLTGFGERTTLSAFSTADLREQQTVQLGNDVRIGPDGMSLSNLFTYAWARPDIADGTDVRANTLLNTIELGFPLQRKLTRTVRSSVGVDFVNQDVRFNGIDLSRDRLRVGFFRLGLDIMSNDFSRNYVSLAEPLWRVVGQIELRHGLSIFGASHYCGPTGAACLGPGETPPSRLEGRPTAFVLRSNLYSEFRPVPKLSLSATIRSQAAWKPLMSFEEFSAGNYTVGRGYDPGSLIGDRGFGSQAEIRFGTRIPKAANKPAIEGYAFWDYAKVANRDRLTIVDQSDHLHSVGGGARIGFSRFALDLALAVPMTRVGLFYERPSPRVLVSLTTRLWPWSMK